MALRNGRAINVNRTSPRKKMLRTGVIVFNDGNTTVDCAIFDLSDSGARLRLTEIDGLPAQFQLQTLNGETYDCELIHKDGNQVGVRFR